MSDGDSIAGSIAGSIVELGKDIVKQTVGSVGDVAKGAGPQVVNTNTPEAEQKKEAEKAADFQRIKAIEAEMAAIRQQNSQKSGPAIQQTQPQTEGEVTNSKPKTLDEASRQAVGRAEQGRNFKG